LSRLAHLVFPADTVVARKNRVLDWVIMSSTPRAIRSSLAAILLAALASPACKSNAAADDAGMVPDADLVTCTTETRAPKFEPGMAVTSQNGMYVLKVMKNTYADAMGKVLMVDPTKGVDQWIVEADGAMPAGDDAGVTPTAPVDGLKIDVVPFMPDHNHGTTAVAVKAQGAGTYLIAPLNLYMAGYWEITFDLTDSSGSTPVMDSAIVKICVPD
jgi:hypothetical protein